MRRLGLWVIFAGALCLGLAGAGWFAAFFAVKSVAGVFGVSGEDASLRGFPLRFDVALMQPELPVEGGLWQADALHLSAPAYWPFRITTLVPPRQRLTLNGQALRLDSTAAKVALTFRPGLELPLDGLRADGAGLSLMGSAPGIFGALALPGGDMTLWTTGGFHLEAQAEAAAEYAVSGHVGGIALHLAALRPASSGSAPAGPAPDAAADWLNIASLRVNAMIRLDRPVAALAAPAPRLVAVPEAQITVTWGESTVTLQGALQVDAAGQISGDMELRVDHWQEALEQGRAARLWDARVNTALTLTAATFAAGDADPAILRAPLTIRDGVVRLGPLTLGNLAPLR